VIILLTKTKSGKKPIAACKVILRLLLQKLLADLKAYPTFKII
jgi:hypothetical protein